MAIIGVDLAVDKERDGNRRDTAGKRQPEERRISYRLLQVAGKHAGNHHAQRHERRADGIMGSLELTL